MKKNLRYYLFIAALMVVASVMAQKNGSKFPAYQPAGRSAGAIMTTQTNSAQYGVYQSTVYSPFSGGVVGGPMRISKGDEGAYHGQITDDGDFWWDEGEESWVPTHNYGDTKIEGGDVYMWNGSDWEKVTNQKDPDGPVGAMPWVMMVMMAAGYAFGKKVARTESQIH